MNDGVFATKKDEGKKANKKRDNGYRRWDEKKTRKKTLILLSNRACSWPFSSIHNFPLDLYYPGVKLDTFFRKKKSNTEKKT